MSAELSLTLHEANDLADDEVRVDQIDLRLLGISPGGLVTVSSGLKTCYARAIPAHLEDRNQGLIRAGKQLRQNIGVTIGQSVKLTAPMQKPELAEEITLRTNDDIDNLYLSVRLPLLTSLWRDRFIIQDDTLNIQTLDRYPLNVKVIGTTPLGPVQVTHATRFILAPPPANPVTVGLGGLRDAHFTCLKISSTRLRHELASHANSIMLTGPAGCGKAQLAKRIAEEVNARLHVLDVHQLLDLQVAKNSLGLENIFPEISQQIPVILLLDNLQALNDHPARHGVTTQLCAMLDELRLHKGIILFGICSGTPDPRLLANRRFDLTLSIDAPDRLGRQEILTLATRNLILDDKVNLRKLALLTHGFTASDLQRLVTAAEVSGENATVRFEDFTSALRTIGPSALSPIACETPEITWNDIGGLDDVKELLLEAISLSLQHQAEFAESDITPPRAILVSGSSGAGKTSLVRAICSVMPLRFIEVSCPVLVAKDIAQANTYIRDCFALAQRKTPCIVFFDDIDVLFGNKSDDHDEMMMPHPVVAQFLSEIDHLPKTGGVIVIAATNRPDRLTNDMMRPGRFDYALSLSMPDEAARKKILQIHAYKLPLASDIDFDQLARTTQGMTPADITNLCNRVGLLALRQSFNNEGGVIPPVVNAALFEQALRGRKN